MDILNFIKKYDIVQHEKVILSSGKVSNLYIDGKKVSLDSEGVKIAANGLYELLVKNLNSFDAIGGLTLGADPLIGAILYHSKHSLKGFIVRKEAKGHGLQKLIEGPVEKGMSCVIVEDVVTTGKSALKAISAAQEFGMKVLGIGCLVNRQEGGDELFQSLNLPLFSLLNASDL